MCGEKWLENDAMLYFFIFTVGSLIFTTFSSFRVDNLFSLLFGAGIYNKLGLISKCTSWSGHCIEVWRSGQMLCMHPRAIEILIVFNMKAIRLLRPKRGFQWLQKEQLLKQSDCYSNPWSAGIARFLGSWGILGPSLLQGRFMMLGATARTSNLLLIE